MCDDVDQFLGRMSIQGPKFLEGLRFYFGVAVPRSGDQPPHPEALFPIDGNGDMFFLMARAKREREVSDPVRLCPTWPNGPPAPPPPALTFPARPSFA